MRWYLLRSIVQTVPVVALVSIIVFSVLRLVPADPATVMLGQDATPEALAQIRQEMGLDQPIPVQYLLWVREALAGNLGVSWTSRQSAISLIQSRLPATVELAVGGMLLGIALALPLGVLSGIRPHTLLDYCASALSLLGVAIPSFWLGLMLVLSVAMTLQLLPPAGFVPLFDDPFENLRRLALPALTLGVGLAAPLARFLRSGMLDVMSTDYIRTARAKGLQERLVVLRHALRNALLSVVTILGLQIGALLGGTVIVESIFNWPGIGSLMLNSISNRDYAVVQAAVLFMTMVFILVNLLVDATYAYLDPRIRT